MNKIEQMIATLCPNGVEYVRLGEVCRSLPKGTLKQNQLIEHGEYPVINSGRSYYGYYNAYNNEGNAITIAARGEYAGFINYSATRFWAGGLCYPYQSTNETLLSTKFLYYYLKSVEKTIRTTLVSRGSIPAINKADTDTLEIPLPPKAVQAEIVRILDKFTELEAELEAELVCRKQQYEYYRDKLLAFNDDPSVRWVKMSELFEFKNGYTPSKNIAEYWDNGTIPWFRMEDIRANGRILSDSIQHITEAGVKGGKLFKAGSFILATTATIGEHALLIADSLANQRFTNLEICESLRDRVEIKFLYHYMYIVDEWCKSHTNISGFASVDMKGLKQLLIPIPPLAEQQRIADILDRFEALTTSLTEGLPAEIATRRQQYEYYRDRLLTFAIKNFCN